MISGKSKKEFKVDGIRYDRHQAGFIAASIGMYIRRVGILSFLMLFITARGEQ